MVKFKKINNSKELQKFLENYEKIKEKTKEKTKKQTEEKTLEQDEYGNMVIRKKKKYMDPTILAQLQDLEEVKSKTREQQLSDPNYTRFLEKKQRIDVESDPLIQTIISQSDILRRENQNIALQNQTLQDILNAVQSYQAPARTPTAERTPETIAPIERTPKEKPKTSTTTTTTPKKEEPGAIRQLAGDAIETFGKTFLDKLFSGSGMTKRTNYKIDENGMFGKLQIDLNNLIWNKKLDAYDGNRKVISKKIDGDFIDLLTKRFDSNRKYTDRSIEMFNKLVMKSGIRTNPKSKKTNLLKGGCIDKKDCPCDKKKTVKIKMYSTADDLIERMKELIDDEMDDDDKNEFFEITDKLLEMGVLSKGEVKQIYDKIM